MVGTSRPKNQAYLQNARVISHLQSIVDRQKFTHFVTVSFVYSRYGVPLNKSDVLHISRLMGAFFNRVSDKLEGRRRKTDTEQRKRVPAIGFPEYRCRMNGSGFLHYHCLISIPDEKVSFFNEVTKDFWKKVVKNGIGYAPRVHSTNAYDPKGAAYYSNKNLEDGFTLENSIFHGISLK